MQSIHVELMFERGVAPWSVPDHMRKPRRAAETLGEQRAALAPVWIEADELRAFKSWWDRLSDGERNARRAFPHGLERADAAWAVIYERQADELLQARESHRVAPQDLAGRE